MIIVLILLCMLVLVTLASSSQIKSESNIPFGVPGLADDRMNDYDGKSASESADFSSLPDNYNFSIIWNAGGISSYDSTDGRLIKDNGARNTGGAVRKLNLGEKKAIKEILSCLPDYDNSGCSAECELLGGSEPADLTLTVRCGRFERTISCPASELSGKVDARLRAYTDACNKIISIITNSNETDEIPAYGARL